MSETVVDIVRVGVAEKDVDSVTVRAERVAVLDSECDDVSVSVGGGVTVCVSVHVTECVELTLEDCVDVAVPLSVLVVVGVLVRETVTVTVSVLVGE